MTKYVIDFLDTSYKVKERSDPLCTIGLHWTFILEVVRTSSTSTYDHLT